MSLSENILIPFLFVLDSFRTHASTAGPQWEVSFQRITSKAEGEALGARRRAMPKFAGHLSRAQDIVLQQLHWSRWHQKANPILPGGKTAHGHPPNSACYSKSHWIKTQLTELRRLSCCRGAAAGLSWKAGVSEGETASVLMEAAGEGGGGGRARGSGGDTPCRGRRHSHVMRLLALPSPHPQPRNRSQDDRQGHASGFSIT